LWRLLQRRPPAGVYHATNSGSCSWYGFAAEIFRQSGMTVALRRTDSRSLGRPAPRPARSVLSNARLRAALGGGLPPWEDALARYLARRTAEAAR
ncbi:MAG TPA: sugar nucleotide-binding protein, partial [Planctomycetota bacterium]|nr:sugar nucleotide-binding protein [Planctomycetota bacterium]